jgi:large subunit ribosomal protein L6
MSRIGKKPIDLPENVSVTLAENKVIVKGKHGLLEHPLIEFLKINIDKNKIFITRTENTAQARELHGLLRALLQNMVCGVNQKFSKVLIAEGVGYKFQMEKKNLLVNVGFTHPVEFLIPSKVKFKFKSLFISGVYILK